MLLRQTITNGDEPIKNVNLCVPIYQRPYKWTARNVIQSFKTSAESSASVWKNEEGKFNTSRLVSDATAGVVLGTVGGVVSSKIIKKKQLEKGYDVLHCTVGGQTVADWGDEFNVGLNK